MMYTEEVYISLLTVTHDKHTQLDGSKQLSHHTTSIVRFQYIWVRTEGLQSYMNAIAFVAKYFNL